MTNCVSVAVYTVPVGASNWIVLGVVQTLVNVHDVSSGYISVNTSTVNGTVDGGQGVGCHIKTKRNGNEIK